jgi:dienelactone hydrolase
MLRAAVPLLVVALAGGLLAGCGHARGAGAASMSVSPQSALIDVPVSVMVRGLPANSTVTVTARATDNGGATWTSSAQFKASSAGVVALDQPSLRGSYTGRNAMGLFEVMTPTTHAAEPYFVEPLPGYDVTLQAEVKGRVVATGVAHRQDPDAVGVTKTDVRPATTHLYGELYRPAHGAGKHPAVLAFGGSEGGLAVAHLAWELAAHGYPTLALAYFKEPGLPQQLANIPLEYFTHALALLRAQPGVDPHHVLVLGISRGGEAALLLGAHYPTLVNGVIAAVPNSLAYGGYPDEREPAWTIGGQPVPTVGVTTDTTHSVIPVEKIAGPVMLTCGGQDRVIASCNNVDQIMARLTAHHFGSPVTALHYPNAGHGGAGGLDAYYSLAAQNPQSGGTVADNQAAGADAHAKLLSFLAVQ